MPVGTFNQQGGPQEMHLAIAEVRGEVRGVQKIIDLMGVTPKGILMDLEPGLNGKDGNKLQQLQTRSANDSWGPQDPQGIQPM